MTATAPEPRTQPPPVVLVTVPVLDDRGPVEIAVRHHPWGVEVDARLAGTGQVWTPIEMVGGSFVTRDS